MELVSARLKCRQPRKAGCNLSREGKRKPGAGRKPSQLKRAAVGDLPQPARLNATLHGATGLQAMLREMLLGERNVGTTEILMSNPITAPIVVTRRAFLAGWLATASAADLRDLAKWVERCPPGQPPKAADPIAHALLALPSRLSALMDKEGRIRRWKHSRGPDGQPCGGGSWVDLHGRTVDFDMLAPAAHPLPGFADPKSLLAQLTDQEILTLLDEFGATGFSSDALRKALKSLGVPRPPRRRNADGTLQ